MAEKQGITRAEISGWIQVALAVVGLFFTVKQAYPALGAIEQFSSGKGLPQEFQGAQGSIQVFLVILSMATFLMLLFVGLAVVLGGLFRHLDASAPRHAAFSLVSAVILGAAAFTLSIFGNLVWVPASLLCVLSIVLAGIAAVEKQGQDESFFWIVTIGGIPAAVVFGIFVVGLMTGGSQQGSQPPGPDKAAISHLP